MKPVAFDIMKYSKHIFLAFFSFCATCFSQEKRERELRIKEDGFPKIALEKLSPFLEDAKRIRFYKEFDKKKTSYEAKFKKDRLFFSVEFDSTGILEDIEYTIESVDIPEESWKKIETYIKEVFDRPRIKKIQQQYPIQNSMEQQTLKDAFQNLLMPYINYELIIASKERKGFREYELLFDANGKFIRARKSIPQKYDHVLY